MSRSKYSRSIKKGGCVPVCALTDDRRRGSSAATADKIKMTEFTSEPAVCYFRATGREQVRRRMLQSKNTVISLVFQIFN